MKKSTRKTLRKLLIITATVILSIMCACVICAAEDPGAGSGFGTVLEQFIDILVGGIERLGGGIGDGVNGYVSNLFLEVDGSGNVTGLSMFGGVAAIFGGVALAIGLTTLIFNWIKSLGS